MAILTSSAPASAQNFFERLFGLAPQPMPQQQYLPPQYRPQPQYRPIPPQYRQVPQRRMSSHPRPAQQAEPQVAVPAAPVAEPPPAPYEKELLRLSEIMGSLAMLRPLCAATDAGEWSKRMQALLEAEGTTPGRRDRLAGAYNKGYQAYALTYRVCTASAQEASGRYLSEGERLAHNIATRYGS